MIKWLIDNFSENIDVPKIILIDEFSAHWTEEFQSKAIELNITVMKIPAGMTGSVQPADISWNKPLKDKLRQRWCNKLMQNFETCIGTFKAHAPKRNDMINWINV